MGFDISTRSERCKTESESRVISPHACVRRAFKLGPSGVGV